MPCVRVGTLVRYSVETLRKCIEDRESAHQPPPPREARPERPATRPRQAPVRPRCTACVGIGPKPATVSRSCTTAFDKFFNTRYCFMESVTMSISSGLLDPTGVLKMNLKRRQPVRRLATAEPDAEGRAVRRGDLVRALDEIPDFELESMTARKLWVLACTRKGVACDGVRGGKGPRPSRSQSSQISQVLAARRRRVKSGEPAAGLSAHPRGSVSLAQAQLALNLVGRYGNAAAVLNELDRLQKFVSECGGLGPAGQCLVIAEAMINGQAASIPGS